MSLEGPSARSFAVARSAAFRAAGDATTLRDLSATHWKSALAAWFGLLFDGLDAYLYVLVATPFVASLMHRAPGDPAVAATGAWIQAAFLLGWALGGAVFGWVGDHVGRSRTMSLTIVLYGLSTGLSTLTTHPVQLLILRFLVGVGIGGEWAAGSALISETWPRGWRPWVSACLWSAYNVGMLLAALASNLFAAHPRYVFLVGAVPAMGVCWMRKNIPEPDEWHAARAAARPPRVGELFAPAVARTTALVTLMCSLIILVAWVILYWYPQALRNLPAVRQWTDPARTRYVTVAFAATTLAALVGNFAGAALAHRLGYRRALAIMFVGGGTGLLITYGWPHGPATIIAWLSVTNFFILGVFGLFPMYIPPLFPTLLRTTGAGFSYNVGRVISAAGVVCFARLLKINDYGRALLYVAALFVPLILLARILPEHSDQFTAEDVQAAAE
ncbi:MAG: MFS transporter [Phycisphaerae bacterium]